MRIIKGETDGFEDYEVIFREKVTFLGIRLPWYRDVTLEGILDADEHTGMVVQQVISPEGHPVYSNGSDDLFNDNTMKLFLLVPGFAKSLLEAGFRPKTTTLYYPKLRITNRNPRPVVIKESKETVKTDG